MIPAIPLITTRIAEPLDVTLWLNASDEQFNAMMQDRYGPDWELDEECEE